MVLGICEKETANKKAWEIRDALWVPRFLQIIPLLKENDLIFTGDPFICLTIMNRLHNWKDRFPANINVCRGMIHPVDGKREQITGLDETCFFCGHQRYIACPNRRCGFYGHHVWCSKVRAATFDNEEAACDCGVEEYFKDLKVEE